MQVLAGIERIGGGIQVTAVELDKETAEIYSEYFPEDLMIVADAHKYLLENFRHYDFIWSSRPCISHSRSRYFSSKGGRYETVYPDLGLYEEIIFLEHFFAGRWVVENVIPYYTPLIAPTMEIGRHMIWCNFPVRQYNHIEVNRDHNRVGQEIYGFDLKGRKLAKRKDQLIRNCVNPDIGLHLFECAFNKAYTVVKQIELF